MTDKLTTSELQNANVQGWTLETVYDTRGYFAQAIVPSRTSPHTSAGDAFQFVWARAKAGDLLCRRALSIVSASELAGKSRSAKTKKGAR